MNPKAQRKYKCGVLKPKCLKPKKTIMCSFSIFLGFEPKKDFAQLSQEIYGSEPEVFTGIKEVNEWVKKATNGQVTDFLASLPPNLVLMLINAVHYKGE